MSDCSAQLDRTCADVALGIGIIFAWRLLAKATLLRVLPPIFRFTANLFDFDLPTRRFYKAATYVASAQDDSLFPGNKADASPVPTRVCPTRPSVPSRPS